MDVSHNIIGIDLMQHFSFTIDLQHKNRQYVSNIIQKCCSNTEMPKAFLMENNYLRTLPDCLNLTEPYHRLQHKKPENKHISPNHGN